MWRRERERTRLSSRLEKPGNVISEVEVTNVSRHGFWLYLAGREIFVAFSDFPWFADASISEITKVAWPSPDHLYWPALDVDLSVRSIAHPEEFPLKSSGR
ncbi:MAG: hypothetical protein QOC81_4761 [Thermoanaerobaculia bacterium]|jgi:hypothetical protein|nr:hypothetical protein [Thermoanaerobaculia bacterium]